MKITEAIAAEHATFMRLFSQIEIVLPSVKSPAEAGAIAAIVAGLLGDHAQAETSFAFAALAQTPLPEDQLEAVRREHQEMDERLLQVRRAGSCAQARRLLRAAMRASIEHFRNEERYLFPVLEQTLKPKELAALGKAFERTRTGEAAPRVPHAVSEEVFAGSAARP